MIRLKYGFRESVYQAYISILFSQFSDNFNSILLGKWEMCYYDNLKCYYDTVIIKQQLISTHLL